MKRGDRVTSKEFFQYIVKKMMSQDEYCRMRLRDLKLEDVHLIRDLNPQRAGLALHDICSGTGWNDKYRKGLDALLHIAKQSYV